MEIFELDRGFVIKLDPTYKFYNDAIAIIKKIENRQWSDHLQSWVVPKNGFASAESFGMHLQAQIENHQLIGRLRSAPVQSLPALDITIPLKKTLRGYQETGTAYCLKHDQVLIGDQQGLGKTMQALAAVVARGQSPGLVICKNSLRYNWQSEILAWTDLRPTIFSDSIKHTWPHLFTAGFFDVGIVNFESLQKYFVKSIRVPPGEPFRIHHILFYEWINLFKWVIVDESHYVKDMKTKRTKLTVGICKGKPQVYLLSGTPALNHPKEVYTQICILNKHKYFGNLASFERMFCGKKNKVNLPALNRLLTEHCYYRRTKLEVAKEIPPKTRQILLCDIDNREEYNKAVDHFKKFLKENLNLSAGQITTKLRAESLVQMMILKKIAAQGKLPAVQEWVDSMVEQDEKFVLFAFHKEIQEKLKLMAPGLVALGGGKKIEEINHAITTFSEDPGCPGIICSISADSEGHNLQAASNVGTVELPWHFGKLEQMEDRTHRIGTVNPVTSTVFIADKTIDRDIYDLIMEKKDMHDMITGSEDTVKTKIIDRIIGLYTQNPLYA